MTLWSLSRRDGFPHAWALLAGAESSGRMLTALCFGALLMECEQRGLLEHERKVLQGLEGLGGDGGNDAHANCRALSAAAVNTAVMRLLEMDQGSQAADVLEDMSQCGQRKDMDADLADVSHCAGAEPDVAAASKPTVPLSSRDWGVPAGTPYAKELRLLNFVLERARPGDAASVCEAIEKFGKEVLNPTGSWLKVAGDSKAVVLVAAVRLGPPRGSVLEIGTYCGYSALQMAIALPGVRIVSLEVDPAHMVVARNVVAFAGMAHVIDVWTGHSKDLLPRLPARYERSGPLLFRAVFMDQRGSRYEDDLGVLEEMGLLLPGAVIVADNVLKPGAPLFLWRILKGGYYETDVVRVREFAMPSEDWMSVSVLVRPLRTAPRLLGPSESDEELVNVAERAAGDDEEALQPIESPQELWQLQWESDRIRERATRPGRSVTFAEWAAFAEDMRERLARSGIAATADAASFQEEAASRLRSRGRATR